MSDIQIYTQAVLSECKSFGIQQAKNDTLDLDYISNDQLPNITDNLDFKNMQKCQRKISIDLKIESRNLKGNIDVQEKYIKIRHIYDSSSRKIALLLTPLILKIVIEPTRLMYPLKYLYNVNSKPIEVVLNKDNVNNYTGCNSYGDAPTCGYQYERGKLIPYSEGYCCACDVSNGNRFQIRGGQDCMQKNYESIEIDSDKDSLYSSAHCMFHNGLWYGVYDILEPILEQKIFLNIYLKPVKNIKTTMPDIDEKESIKWLDLTNDQTMILDTEANIIKSPLGKIKSFKLNKVFATSQAHLPLDHVTERLAMPLTLSPDKVNQFLPQIKEGLSESLVIDSKSFDGSGLTCNKMGVSFQGFKGQSSKCFQQAQSCFKNQPFDFWIDETIKTRLGGLGKNILKNRGILFPKHLIWPSHSLQYKPNQTGSTNTRKNDSSSSESKDPVLSVMFNRSFTKSEQLGDSVNVMFIYSKPVLTHTKIHVFSDQFQTTYIEDNGIITSIITRSLDAITNIQILIMNTGVSEAFFQIKISGCSGDFKIVKTFYKLIAPAQIRKLVLDVVFDKFQRQNLTSGKNELSNPSSCRTDLLNDIGKIISSRTFLLAPNTICACIGLCKCSCENGISPMICESIESPAESKAIGYFRIISNEESNVGIYNYMPAGMFPYKSDTTINNLLQYLFWGLLTIIGITIIKGVCKAAVGLLFPSVGAWGLRPFCDKNLKQYYEKNLKKMPIKLDLDGQPVNPYDGTPVRQMGRLKEFLLNLIFFFLLPFVGLHYICYKFCTPKDELKLSKSPVYDTDSLKRNKYK